MRNLTGEEYAATKYTEYFVNEASLLMDFLERIIHGISKNKLKDILRGRGITVDRKLVTQYNYQLQPGSRKQAS